MKCPNCKGNIRKDNKFCPECGIFLDSIKQNNLDSMGAWNQGTYEVDGAEDSSTVQKVGKTVVFTLLMVALMLVGVFLGGVIGKDAGDSDVVIVEVTPTPTMEPTLTPAPTPKVDPIYLAQLAPIKLGPSMVTYYLHNSKDGEVQDSEKNSYKYGITLDCGKLAEMYAQFELKSRYTEFTFYYGSNLYCGEPDASRTKNIILVFYYADGTSQSIELDERRYDTPTRFYEFDVTGVETLEICYPATKGYNDLAELFDAKLR